MLRTVMGAGLKGNPTAGGLRNKAQKMVEVAPMRNYGLSYQEPIYPPNVPPTSYPFYAKPINPLQNAPMYRNYGPTGLFADSTGCVTPFVFWIEDYPLPNGLKMPSHIGSYDGKGDPNNYLHLFEGVVHMQKWAMPIAFHMFTYTLKDSARIWWNGQKASSIILGLHEEQRISGFVHVMKTRSLVEYLSTDLPTTYKGLMEKTYTWIEAKEVATNGASNDHREGFDIFNKDHGHETNQCRELRHQIEKALKSRKLAHLVKGINKGKAKASDTQIDEWKKGDK
ncbi:hypothetical protein Tco_1406745 [Tanacetum coccineum]